MKYIFFLALLSIAFSQVVRTTAIIRKCDGSAGCFNSTLYADSLPVCGKFLPPMMCLNVTDIPTLQTIDNSVMLTFWEMGNNTDVGFDPLWIPCRNAAIQYFCSITFPACDKDNNQLSPCWSQCNRYYSECGASDLIDWRCDPTSWGQFRAGQPTVCTGSE